MTRPEWRVQGTKPLMYSHTNSHNIHSYNGYMIKVIKSRFAKYGVRHVNTYRLVLAVVNFMR